MNLLNLKPSKPLMLLAAMGVAFSANAAIDCTGFQTWQAGEIYHGGTKVVQNGDAYKANWYSSGHSPSQYSGPWQEWSKLDQCSGDGPLLPIVDWIAPLNGAQFVEGDVVNLEINAIAQEDQGYIATVKFFDNGDLIASINHSTQYQYTPAVGEHVLTASATDNDVQTGYAAPINISVKAKSTGNCDTPSFDANAQYVKGDLVENNQTLYRCEVTGWCDSSTWAYEPGVGTYWQNAWSSQGQCDTVLPLEVQITQPLPAQEYNLGQTVPIQATAQVGEPTTVVNIKAFVNDVLIAQSNNGSIATSYVATMLGLHEVRVVATDSEGNMIEESTQFNAVEKNLGEFNGQLPSIGEAAVIAQIKVQYDAWKSKYLTARPDVQDDQKFVWYKVDERFQDWADQKQAVTVSEAHGYGMLILSNMAAMDASHDAQVKTDFDAMVRYLLAHPSSIDPRLMAWQQWTDGIDRTTGIGEITNVYNTPEGADSAIDGDLDIAYALYNADEIWGSDGVFNYRQIAQDMVHGILESEVHATQNVLLLGDWVNQNDPKYGKATRPSDFMLQHLRMFAQKDSINEARWLAVLEKTQNVFKQNVQDWSNNTGLIADFLILDVNDQYQPSEPNFLEGTHDGDYYYNSARVPWRIAMDYLYNADNTVVPELEMINNWIQTTTNNNPAKIYPGYTIKSNTVGTPIETSYIDLTFSAPFAVSAAAFADNQAWIDQLWAHLSNDNIAVNDDFYFGNSIRLLSLIGAGGQWYVPTAP